MSLLIDLSTVIIFKLQVLPWQRKKNIEVSRFAIFGLFLKIQHHFQLPAHATNNFLF